MAKKRKQAKATRLTKEIYREAKTGKLVNVITFHELKGGHYRKTLVGYDPQMVDESVLLEIADNSGVEETRKYLAHFGGSNFKKIIEEKDVTQKQQNIVSLFILALMAFQWRDLATELANIYVNSQKVEEPSKNLLFIVGLFYSAKEREAVRGDLEEIFRKEAKKFGRSKAHLYMVRDFLVSMYPVTKRVLVRLLKWVTFYAILKRIIS